MQRALDEAEAFAEKNAGAPISWSARFPARSFLHSNMASTPEVTVPAQAAAQADEIASGYYGVAELAANRLVALTDFTSGDLYLGDFDEPIRELDRLECAAWARLVERMAVVAGES